MCPGNRDCALEQGIGAQSWLRLLSIVTRGRLLREPRADESLVVTKALAPLYAYVRRTWHPQVFRAFHHYRICPKNKDNKIGGSVDEPRETPAEREAWLDAIARDDQREQRREQRREQETRTVLKGEHDEEEKL